MYWRFTLPDSNLYEIKFHHDSLPHIQKLRKTHLFNNNNNTLISGKDSFYLFNDLNERALFNSQLIDLYKFYNSYLALPYSGIINHNKNKLNAFWNDTIYSLNIQSGNLQLFKKTGIPEINALRVPNGPYPYKVQYSKNAKGLKRWLFTFDSIYNFLPNSRARRLHSIAISDSGTILVKKANLGLRNQNYKYGFNYLSNDGRMLVSTTWQDSIWSGVTFLKRDDCVFWDFNSSTGEASNIRTLIPGNKVSSMFASDLCLFSSNDSIIWITFKCDLWTSYGSAFKPTSYPIIWQYNRYTKQIYQHKTVSRKYDPKLALYYYPVITSFDMGPDGRIYYTWADDKCKGNLYLGIIDNPNAWGSQVVFYDTFLKTPNRNVCFTWDPYDLRYYETYFSLGNNYQPVWWAECIPLTSNTCTDTSRFQVNLDTALSAVLYFGDGDSMQFSRPNNRNYTIKHVYPKSGDYTVILKYKGPFLSDECQYRRQKTTVRKEVRIPPGLAWKDSITCQGTMSSLKDSFDDIDKLVCSWNADSSSIVNKPKGLVHLQYLYSQKDTAVRQLQVWNEVGCQKTLTDSIKPRFLEHPALSVLPVQPTCEHQTLYLANTAALPADTNYWKYNGLLATSLGVVKIGLTLKKTADTIMLRTYNKHGCSADTVFTVTIKPITNAVFTINDTAFCSGASLQLSRSAQNTTDTLRWYWQNSFAPDTASTTSLIAESAGLWLLEHQVKSTNGCADTSRMWVRVNPKPNVTITSPNTLHCTGNDLLLFRKSTAADDFVLWHSGPLTSAQPDSIMVPVNTAGIWKTKLWVSNKFGCRDSALRMDTILQGITTRIILNDSLLCTGDTMKLSATNPADSLRWNIGEASWPQTMWSREVIEPTGHYSVLLTAIARNGCKATLISGFSVQNKPRPGYTVSGNLCQSNELVFTDTTSGDLNSVIWQIDTQARTGSKATYKPSNPGKLGIMQTVISSFGCMDSVYTYLNIYPMPKPWISLTGTQYADDGKYKVLFAGMPDTFRKYSWNFGIFGTSNQQKQHLEFNNVEFTDSFHLLVTDQRGCQGKADSIMKIPGLTLYLFPTSFTPNGDGINDEFKIAGPEYIKQFKLHVFNRWGEKVFYTEDPYEGWQPAMALPGMYVYKAVVQDFYSRWKEVKGTVVLIR
jgi:gliding motility-associated-like protein